MEEKEIDELVDRVKKELQQESLDARKEQEVKKIDEQIAQIEGDDSLKEAEKKMHMSFLIFNKRKTELMFTDIEKAKQFEDIEQEYNKEQQINVIRINPQGDSVVELRVPQSEINNLDELLISSGNYWDTLNDKLKEIING
jgi:hypothetical protein